MRLALRLWIVIFIIGVLWVNYIFISPKIFNNKIVEIPDILDLPIDEGMNKLDDIDIEYRISYVESDDEKILKTIPHSGTKIKAGTIVSVYVGKKFPVKYRTYVGLIYNNVSNQIIEFCGKNNIKLIIEYEESSSINGMIIRESIVDGEVISEKGELIITIAKNSSYYLMPNLIGLDIDSAIEIINNYGIKVNIIYYCSPIDEDIIIYQSVEPNSLIYKGNSFTIDIYVSKVMEKNAVINVDRFIEVIEMLNYDLEINYIDSNEKENKLVAFKVQKLYDINMIKYILWVTK